MSNGCKAAIRLSGYQSCQLSIQLQTEIVSVCVFPLFVTNSFLLVTGY